ncbi:RNA-binding cell elongation regulator Jag/EloR [Actinomycetota bacterium]|jgi:spoIIIJ-associated protein
MEWVEVQGKTIDLAVDVAMSELGVGSREDIQVEVIQEPKAGFLGMGGQEAIVKVTKAPRKRRRNRGRGRGSSSASTSSGNGDKDKGSQQNGRSQKSTPRNGGAKRQEAKVAQPNNSKDSKGSDDRPEQAPIEEQAKVAADFVRGLLEAFGLEGEVGTRIEDDVLYIDVQGEQTEALIGPKGSVMQSVLELTRTVVQRKTYGAPRMRIDVGGYAERRREALKIYASKLAAQVIEDQSEIMLEPMNAADRKVLHDAVAEIDGVRSYSEGEDPRRAVVIAYEGGS